MTRPVVHDETERWYGRLPEFYRLDDEDATNADGSEVEYYPLLRYISGVGQEAGNVVDLQTRFDYFNNGVTSDLVDPITADNDWITWLAAIAGVRGAGGESDVETASFHQIFTVSDTNSDGTTTWSEVYNELNPSAPSFVTWQQLQDVNIAQRIAFIGSRTAIQNRYTYGHDDGTSDSIVRAVKEVLLSEDPYCFVGNREEAIAVGLTTTPASQPSDPWDIYIVVLESEEPPGLSGILGGVIAPVKPAGMQHVLVYKTP